MKLQKILLATAALTALAVAAVAPAGAAVAFRAADDAMLETYRQHREAALRGDAGTPTPLATRASATGTRLIMPFYQVDTRSAAATTSLFAVRSATTGEQAVSVAYLDRLGREIASDHFSLGPHQTRTVNLRDLGLEPEADGLARGVVVVESTGKISGDFFLVSPERQAASGSRMFDVADSTFCRVWDIRYANGGPFDGGTDLTVMVGQPLGADPERDRMAAMFEVFDEKGRSYGVVFFWTDYLVNRLPVADILASLPSSPPSGALEVTFPDDSGGGLIEASFQAHASQFSVGFDGNCVSAE